MIGIEQLLTLAREYARAEGIELTTVSSRVFDDAKKFAALEEGRDIQTRRLAKAVAWFSENWPKEATWPLDIDRPTVAAQSDAVPS